MKKCYFRSFDVGIGDCNVIRIVDGDKQYSIMVDCGRFTTPVKDYVIYVLNKHIDILIATHIDGDHVSGLGKMLTEISDIKIDHIWYNVYRRTAAEAPVDLTEQQEQVLEWIKKELPVEFDAINYRREISAQQGKTLSKAILKNSSWECVWKKEYITDETADFTLPDGLGKIVFLSPTNDAITAIDALFKDAFNKYFMQEWNEGIKNSEELSELLLRLVEAYKSKYEAKPVSATITIDEKYISNQAATESLDDSVTNYSSIAFMLELGNHRIAMLGDAYASVVLASLNNKYKEIDSPIRCEAIKVSHHGSNGNSSKDLLNRINAPFYFIPGGKGTDYPAWGTLGRIVLSSQDMKTIVFSHKCDMSEQMDSLDKDVKDALKMKTVITENEYELFEW